ncbi:MAG: mechanosensitive ion channel domain-containing protein [Pseudomonadota bacterium]
MKNNVYRKAFVSLGSLILLATLSFPSQAGLPAAPSNTSEKAVSIPSDIQPDQVGEFVAPLNEQQVRQLLIAEIEKKAELNSQNRMQQSGSVIDLIKGVRHPDSPLIRGFRSTIEAAGSFWSAVGAVFEKISPGESTVGFFTLIGVVLLTLFVAWIFEWVCLMWLRSWLQGSHAKSEQAENAAKSGSALWGFSINLAGLVVFMLAGYTCAAVLTEEGRTLSTLVDSLFGAILVTRFFCFVFRLLLFPAPDGIELIDDRVSYRALYRCMAAFTFAYTFGTELGIAFVEQGVPGEQLTIYFLLLFGLIVNPIVFWFVWSQRYAVDRVMFGARDNEGELVGRGQHHHARRAVAWPLLVTLIITLAYLNWQIQAMTKDTSRQAAIELAWWATILFPIVDLLVSSLLIKLVGLNVFQTTGFKRRAYRVTYIIRTTVRFIMLTVLTLSFLEAWGFSALDTISSSAGGNIIDSVVDIGVTVLLGFIIWEGILLAMESRLPEPEDDGAAADIEGEGGGAAASRSETLLPLFRSILLILLCAIVITSVLYSLGVQIGPLLAGASVVGIAIGFGSQKLVQDIISGMFFLIDDAFRRGEYVEVAGLKGTIEKLSLRSMQLRHHLGAVQTIPYGEINTVKNVSRDWVIMKLELRLPYDVDIEKVRKIIKKIGQEMIQDEVTGPMMLQPLKSQGVMRVEESALIVRMKFTAKPGEQWIVRRVAYTRVRDALAAAGIEFAHREVKVRMPPEFDELHSHALEDKSGKSNLTQDNRDEGLGKGLVGAAAAAVTGVVAADLAKQDKIDDADGNDDPV